MGEISCVTCVHQHKSKLAEPCWSCSVGRPCRWEPAPASTSAAPHDRGTCPKCQAIEAAQTTHREMFGAAPSGGERCACGHPKSEHLLKVCGYVRCGCWRFRPTKEDHDG